MCMGGPYVQIRGLLEVRKNRDYSMLTLGERRLYGAVKRYVPLAYNSYRRATHPAFDLPTMGRVLYGDVRKV